MKSSKLRELTPEELRRQLDDTQAELLNLQVRKATRQLEQPSRIRLLRREVARIQTLMRERAEAVR